MPRRSNLKGASKAATAPEGTVASTQKTHLRTYSRRALKRRHTSPPAQHMKRLLTRTESLNVTGKQTAEQRSQAEAQHLPRPGSGKGVKRAGLLNSAGNTANDLAREALASSYPLSTRQDDYSQDEDIPGEAHTVECSPGQKRPEYEQPAIKHALSSSNVNREGKASSEGDSAGYGSLEGSDDVQDGEKR